MSPAPGATVLKTASTVKTALAFAGTVKISPVKVAVPWSGVTITVPAVVIV